MGALFVTGTGTEIGKTFVCCALIAAFRARGHAIDAIKPVISGFDATQPAASDTGELIRALGLPCTAEHVGRVSPWRFRAALGPTMAAARDGRRLDVEAVIAHSRAAIAAAGETVLLVEGVGGIMVPLSSTRTVVDWVVALGVPALLVTGTYLGTLSHTLTALSSARAHGVRLAAIVVNESLDGAVSLDETAATIRRFADPLPVLELGRADAGRYPGDLARLADAISAVTRSAD